MKRVVMLVLAAVSLSAVTVAPAAGSGSQTSASFDVSVCRDVLDELQVTSTWANETVVAGNLTLTFEFKGKQLSAVHTATVFGPVPATGTDTEFFVTTPDQWTRISVSTTGAFDERSTSVRQPKGGWAPC